MRRRDGSILTKLIIASNRSGNAGYLSIAERGDIPA